MYDQFDKKLAERIKYVFDAYEDDSYDIGWKELRKRYPASKKRRSLIYWMSTAAAIAVLALGTWLYEKQGKETETIARTEKPKLPVPKESVRDTRGWKALHGQKPTTYMEDDLANASTGRKGKERLLQDGTEPSATSAETSPRAALFSNLIADKANNSTRGNESLNHELGSDNLGDVTATAKNTAQTSTGEPVEKMAEIKTGPAKTTVTGSVHAAENGESEKAVAPLSQEEYNRLQGERLANIKNIPSVKETREKQAAKVSLGFFAGSYMNYAEGSKGGMNAGVGLSSEIGITKRLRLSTGVALARNTLKYDKMIPSQAADVFLATPSQSETLLASTFQAKTSSLSYSINGYDASLLGLDFPVDVKYMLMENKRELYVVAGLSSNLFLDEAYTYNYEYNTNSNDYPNEKTTGSTNTFDFARMLNLSIGFGYPVGKQNKLSFEPFVKYPLGGLGSQDIRFGSAGLNLKLSFRTK